MEKNPLKSKAIWGAIITFIGGGLAALGYTQFAEIVFSLGIALGIIGIRTAQK